MKRALGISAALVFLSLATAVSAGPTAISACGKTITKTGSYTLTNNLAVKKGGGTCITISANNVTIDLGGYNINCNAVANANGIATSGLQSGITIRNGFVHDCFNGVDTYTSGATGAMIDEVLALNNSNTGIAVNEKSTVIHSIANGNTNFAGIFALCPSNILYNTAVNNLVTPPSIACPDSTTTCYNDIDWFDKGDGLCHFSCNAYDPNTQALIFGAGSLGSCP
jgi:hypothetical protein